MSAATKRHTRNAWGSNTVPHFNPDDGTCNCECELCYDDGLQITTDRCICPGCNVAACGMHEEQPKRAALVDPVVAAAVLRDAAGVLDEAGQRQAGQMLLRLADEKDKKGSSE